ncbi:MAG: hypothetical protein FJ278_00140 [Planctomycetes bacterium]|nr:hypothetical protein [Planctomycetota bacterium]
MGAIVKLDYAELLDEIEALKAMIRRIDRSMARAADWLVSEFAPDGPIMRERNVSYCHKVTWGLYEAGRIPEVVRLIEWLDKHAKRAPGEYYFPEEVPFEKDMQRVYRPLTFGKVAEAIRHPAFAHDATRDRLLQYQHKSGAAANNIDNGFPAELEPLNTTFFGHWALAAGLMDPATRAGDWVAELVELNGKHLKADPPRFFYKRERDTGKLVTKFAKGQRMNTMIDTVTVKQPSWVTGTCMALLADLYAVTKKQRYLDAALKLGEFEKACDPKLLFWPSKCKVGWGAAELYRVTCDPAHRKIAAAVARTTFMDQQLPHGGWSHMFYPLCDEGEWRKVVYSGPNRDVPTTIRQDGTWGWLSGHEITGEFMGELGRTRAAFQAVLSCFESQRYAYEQKLALKG